MLTSSSHQHEGFVNFTPARGLRQFHTGMRASPMCVQRLADSVRSRLICCHGMWKHVDAGSCPIYCPSRGPITHQMAHVRLFGRVPPRRRCNTVWEVTPRSRAKVRASGRGRVCDLVCVCVWSLHPGRRARSLTGADQHQALYSRLCERGRLPDSLPGPVRLPILANDDQVQDVLRPRPRPPSQYQ